MQWLLHTADGRSRETTVFDIVARKAARKMLHAIHDSDRLFALEADPSTVDGMDSETSGSEPDVSV